MEDFSSKNGSYSCIWLASVAYNFNWFVWFGTSHTGGSRYLHFPSCSRWNSWWIQSHCNSNWRHRCGCKYYASLFHKLLGWENLWMAFGVGSSYHFINVAVISSALGSDKFAGLLAFSSLTGCSTISQFKGKGKQTARTTWKIFPHHSIEVFEHYPTYPLLRKLMKFCI